MDFTNLTNPKNKCGIETLSGQQTTYNKKEKEAMISTPKRRTVVMALCRTSRVLEPTRTNCTASNGHGALRCASAVSSHEETGLSSRLTRNVEPREEDQRRTRHRPGSYTLRADVGQASRRAGPLR